MDELWFFWRLTSKSAHSHCTLCALAIVELCLNLHLLFIFNVDRVQGNCVKYLDMRPRDSRYFQCSSWMPVGPAIIWCLGLVLLHIPIVSWTKHIAVTIYKVCPCADHLSHCCCFIIHVTCEPETLWLSERPWWAPNLPPLISTAYSNQPIIKQVDLIQQGTLNITDVSKFATRPRRGCASDGHIWAANWIAAQTF